MKICINKLYLLSSSTPMKWIKKISNNQKQMLLFNCYEICCKIKCISLQIFSIYLIKVHLNFAKHCKLFVCVLESRNWNEFTKSIFFSINSWTYTNKLTNKLIHAILAILKLFSLIHFCINAFSLLLQIVSFKSLSFSLSLFSSSSWMIDRYYHHHPIVKVNWHKQNFIIIINSGHD